MKNYCYVFGLTLALVGCKQEQPVDYAIVEGNISNYAGKELAINHLTGDYNGKINLKEDGSFIDTLKTEKGTFALSDGKNKVRFYLEEGDRIKVNYDAANAATSMNFEGSAAATATYYRAKEEIYRDLKGQVKNIFTLSESEFLSQLKTVRNAHEELLSGVETLPESFRNLEALNIKYEYLSQVNNYEVYHGYYTGNREFRATDTIKSELSNIDLSDQQAYEFSPSYRNLLVGTYNRKASEMVKQDSLEQSIALLKAISGNSNQKIKDELMYDNAKVYLAYSEDVKAFYELYMSSVKNEAYKQAIQKDYELMLTLSEGNPSPEFTDYENHKGGTTSLNDLRGKYVYIDVWATWCGPCKREIPFLKKLEADYHGKEIEFVSISIDVMNDHKKWRKMVDEMELGGIQLFADNNWESQFVQDYMIKGIPRFILIDPEGNIVNSNAPRPSSNDIREVFNSLEI